MREREKEGMNQEKKNKKDKKDRTLKPIRVEGRALLIVRAPRSLSSRSAPPNWPDLLRLGLKPS